MMESHLPVGWSLVKIKDILNFIGGGTPSKSRSEYWIPEVSWASVKDIKTKFLYKTQDQISEISLTKSATNVAEKNEILLITRINPGKACITKIRTAINQDLKIVRPFLELSPNFLYYLFNNLEPKILERSSGTTVLGVSLNNLNELTFPLPPLAEQHRIVAKIEELFSELDKGIETLKTAKQQLKVYRQAVLKYAFEGRLTNPDVKEGELPEGWNIVNITSLISKNKSSLKAGPFGSSLKKEFLVESGFKVYGQEQVIKNSASFGNYYITKEKYEELISCSVKPGDILISLVGTVGKVLLLPENAEQGVINPRLIKVSLDESVYLPKFFKHYFESAVVKNYYSSKAQGTTMDVLNLGIIKTIPFPITTLEVQKVVVQEIESRLSVCDKIEETILQGLQQAEALRQSILKKAFEGKLVPQDPNDEPASVLLERIKAERASAQPLKKTKTKKVKT